MRYKKGSNGLYKASVYLGRKTDGKENRKYVYAKTQKELEEKLIKEKSLYNQGVTDNKMTVKNLANKWFELTQTKNQENTKNRNKGILDNYISKLYFYKLSDLKSFHIQELLNNMLCEGKTDTVRKTKQIISSMLQLAVNNNWCVRNVASSVSIPTFRSKEKTPLTKEEREIIENSTNKYKDFFMVLLYTGMRKGEITALTWKDVCTDHISVNKSTTFIHNQAVIKSTKNGKSRNIPILDKIRPIFKPGGKGYVFTKADGGPLSDIAIRRMLESFKKDTGLDFTLHQLRHTFCTLLYYSGISSKKAQEIMGHSSIDVTMKIYTHLDDEQEGNISNKLNAFLE